MLSPPDRADCAAEWPDGPLEKLSRQRIADRQYRDTRFKKKRKKNKTKARDRRAWKDKGNVPCRGRRRGTQDFQPTPVRAPAHLCPPLSPPRIRAKSSFPTRAPGIQAALRFRRCRRTAYAVPCRNATRRERRLGTIQSTRSSPSSSTASSLSC